MEAERAAGRKPYFFPVGASIPLGCWGYIRCMAEMVEQLGRETKVDVFSAVSSAGTHAGLMLGKALFGLDNWRIVGVPVSDSVEYFQREIRALVDQTVASYGLGIYRSANADRADRRLHRRGLRDPLPGGGRDDAPARAERGRSCSTRRTRPRE